MKTIMLMRHAKSDWSRPGQSDEERGLQKRGMKDSPLMGKMFASFGAVPDQILSSPVKRARKTAELVAGHCGYEGDIVWMDGFYPGSYAAHLDALHRLADDVERPLLIGHNPGMDATVQRLLHEKFSINISLPTAAVVCFEAEIDDWTHLKAGICQLLWYVVPRLVKSVTSGG